MVIPCGDGGFCSNVCFHALHSIHVNLIIHDFLGKEKNVGSMLSATTPVTPLLPVTPCETCRCSATSSCTSSNKKCSPYAAPTCLSLSNAKPCSAAEGQWGRGMGLLLVTVLPGHKAEQEAQEFRARRVEPGSFLPTFFTEESFPRKFYACL